MLTAIVVGWSSESYRHAHVKCLLIQRSRYVVPVHVRKQLLWHVAHALDVLAFLILGDVGVGVLRVEDWVANTKRALKRTVSRKARNHHRWVRDDLMQYQWSN